MSSRIDYAEKEIRKMLALQVCVCVFRMFAIRWSLFEEGKWRRAEDVCLACVAMCLRHSSVCFIISCVCMDANSCSVYLCVHVDEAWKLSIQQNVCTHSDMFSISKSDPGNEKGLIWFHQLIKSPLKPKNETSADRDWGWFTDSLITIILAWCIGN